MLSLIRLGHPALRIRSTAVAKKQLATKRFQKFLDELVDLCLKSNGAGIAAPQVGVNKRVIVVHVDPKNPRYPGKRAFPLTIVINPKIIAHAQEKSEDWEGDLSVDLRGLVPRFITCTVAGLDRSGKPISFKLDYAFHARVFQHEIDHLNGIMFVDRVKKTKSLSEYEEWKKYWKNS